MSKQLILGLFMLLSMSAWGQEIDNSGFIRKIGKMRVQTIRFAALMADKPQKLNEDQLTKIGQNYCEIDFYKNFPAFRFVCESISKEFESIWGDYSSGKIGGEAVWEKCVEVCIEEVKAPEFGLYKEGEKTHKDYIKQLKKELKSIVEKRKPASVKIEKWEEEWRTIEQMEDGENRIELLKDYLGRWPKSNRAKEDLNRIAKNYYLACDSGDRKCFNKYIELFQSLTEEYGNEENKKLLLEVQNIVDSYPEPPIDTVQVEWAKIKEGPFKTVKDINRLRTFIAENEGFEPAESKLVDIDTTYFNACNSAIDSSCVERYLSLFGSKGERAKQAKERLIEFRQPSPPPIDLDKIVRIGLIITVSLIVLILLYFLITKIQQDRTNKMNSDAAYEKWLDSISKSREELKKWAQTRNDLFSKAEKENTVEKWKELENQFPGDKLTAAFITKAIERIKANKQPEPEEKESNTAASTRESEVDNIQNKVEDNKQASSPTDNTEFESRLMEANNSSDLSLLKSLFKDYKTDTQKAKEIHSSVEKILKKHFWQDESKLSNLLRDNSPFLEPYQNSIQEQLKTLTSKYVYVSGFNPNGYFDRYAVKAEQDARSTFRLRVSDDGNSAQFALLEADSIWEQLKLAQQEDMEGACQFTNFEHRHIAEGFNTIEEGTLIFRDSRWEIQSKTKVEFV